MNLISQKPHLIFLLSIPIIILIGFLSGTEPLDINLHDTYYVIEHGVITILISIVFGIICKLPQKPNCLKVEKKY